MALDTHSLLDGLNEQQRYAATFTSGPLLILAGAGSGKTRTLTYRIAHIIQQGLCRPNQILAATFTNKAADEMKGRVADLLGPMDCFPHVSTFHSFGVRTLRRHANRIGYGNDFTICDADDQRAVYRQVMKELDLGGSSGPPIRRVQALVSHAKNRAWSPEQYLRHSHHPDAPLIANIYRAYESFLKRANAMDFDDLILQTVKLFKTDQEIREHTSSWYRFLLIDEYQDTNFPQYELVRQLTCQHRNLCAVGDEDQSIYGFRGAEVANILRFEEDFPGAKLVKLEQNYRSTQIVLDAAAAVVANNQRRKNKVLWTTRQGGDLLQLIVAGSAKEEARLIAQKIYRLRRSGERDVAILYRTNFQSRQFEESLRLLEIPYQLIGGVSFYSRQEVKDALAFLRSVSNPADSISLARIINRPRRGIGKVTLQKMQQSARRDGSSLWEVMGRFVAEHRLAGAAHRNVDAFRNRMEQCQPLLELPLHLALEKILKNMGYLNHLRELDTPEANDRLLNLDELLTVAREHQEQGASLQDFLDQSSLYAETDDFENESEKVVMMTVHNAKGLEFSTVFLAGCEEGLFPHSRSAEPEELEEERRLCYVGMTRARDHLILSYSRTRRSFGRESEGLNQPSRFLSEIPQRLIRRSDETRLPNRQPAVTLSRRRNRYSGRTFNTKESVAEFLQQRGMGSRATPQLRRGDLVAHAMFGPGKVLQVEPTGQDLKITVHFSNSGIKKLLQSFADLKRI